jgi:ketosteroid isomerase-like protein
MTNVELVKQSYAYVASGNIPGALTLMDSAIEWYECKGMPFVKGDGIFRGHNEVVDKVFMNLPVYFDGFNIAVNEIIGVDDKVVMAGYY